MRDWSKYDTPERRAANLAYRLRRYAEDPEYREKVKARSRRRPPEVHRAQELVRYHVKHGKLAKPDVCEECGETGVIEPAHQDYSKPLEVRWLCRPCHRKADYDNPKAAALGCR